MIRIVRVELRAPKADIGEAWSNRRKQLRYVKGPPSPRPAVLSATLFCPRLRQSTEPRPRHQGRRRAGSRGARQLISIAHLLATSDQLLVQCTIVGMRISSRF
jgi:hypothetical protein